jgi:predicted permease
MYGQSFNIVGEHETERVDGQEVTPNLLPMIGVRPMLGRHFRPDDALPGAAPGVILSHALWQRRFGADPAIVGGKAVLNGRPRTVVGVMPPRFAFPTHQELWVPAVPDAAEARDDRYVWTVARLAPGATLAQARSEAAAIGRQLAAEHPATNADWELAARPIAEEFVGGQLRVMMVLMLGSVGFVLLIACANVANLLLARATGRERELAVRAALGASRARIVRLLLTESLLIAVAGGALGVVLGSWYNRSLLASIPEQLPYWLRIEVDPTVLAYTALLSAGTALVFGTLPALRASRPDLSSALTEGGRGSGAGVARSRLRSTLAGAQVALAVVLLVGASLMVRSFFAMRGADLGTDDAHLLTLRTYLAGERYAGREARAAFYARLTSRLEALPGVERAAAVTALPADDGGQSATVVADGQPVERGGELLITAVGATPGAFATLGAGLRAGRDFTAREAADSLASVAIVNEALARRLWPNESPLGRRLTLKVAGGDSAGLAVVGVAPDLVYEELGEQTPESRLQLYAPYARMPWRGMAVVVHTRGAPGPLAAAARREVRALDAALPAFDVRTMDEVRRYTTWPYRLWGQSFATFGLLALGLATVGVYGVMAYTVAQRRHEIGVRMAIGARASDVLRQVVGRGARLVAPGAAGGLLLAAARSRPITGVLSGAGPAPAATFVVVPALIVGVALLASYVPARRAARVSPAEALRSD